MNKKRKTKNAKCSNIPTWRCFLNKSPPPLPHLGMLDSYGLIPGNTDKTLHDLKGVLVGAFSWQVDASESDPTEL